MIRPEDIKRQAHARLTLPVDDLMKGLFTSTAFVSIVVLVLIMVFLFREGIGFFPQNLRNLKLYRRSGLEFVDIIRRQVDEHTGLSRNLQALRLEQWQVLTNRGLPAETVAQELGRFDVWMTEFDEAIDPLRGLMNDAGDAATAIKEKAIVNEDLLVKKRQLAAAGKQAEAAAVETQTIDFGSEVQAVTAALPLYQETARALRARLHALCETPPPVGVPQCRPAMGNFLERVRGYLARFDDVERQLTVWRHDEPVPWYRTLSAFLFGREWITNSFLQDWYGILPLLAGSVTVSVIALTLAVPFGVCGAIYVSEIAGVREQRIIKPCIEFIAAIPSVVLGFFGIAVLGETLRWLSHQPWLAWVPFFPVNERLNALTAGCLLALMAVPTIFSLAEDALNNVPRGYKEASYALGANRLQTIVRILVPASLSGIISAVLLGFGRVIGETMVVLLCAGNRIAIPDFTAGFGALVQPVHTMTGIIAQEMGEVPFGTIHYRALFMVGVVLFLISLAINYAAQRLVHRFRISIG